VVIAKTIRCLALVVVLPLAGGAGPVQAQRADASDEAATAAYFDAVRGDPNRALIFLRAMPKGGELHSHLSGAVYAETYIEWAAEEGLCVDTQQWTLVRPPCDADRMRPPASVALQSPSVRNPLVDAMSLRNWHPSQRSGHEQFFGSFDRFRLISHRSGDMLADIASRAAAGGVMYMEQMITADGAGAASIARQLGWDPDLERLRAALLRGGLRDTLALARARLDEAEARQRDVLGCASARPDPGCGVVIRYQYQALRARPPEVVFAHLLAGFELATMDDRVVGINLVQPEDHPLAVRDYSLHMQMIAALGRHYPGVGIALHAGELVAGLVPPSILRSHIRQAVEVAGARRIGHGVSIAHEEDAYQLLDELARRNVLVEVALSSNDQILGVRGRQHPLSLYLQHGVPVTLVTDDEGVSRSEMTMEYLKAVEEHGLGYLELKQFARNSLEHAFIGGASLWQDARTAAPVAACATAAGGLGGAACRAYIGEHPKARLQHDLERAFTEFEREQARRQAVLPTPHAAR
jgi:adenosine deaminase